MDIRTEDGAENQRKASATRTEPSSARRLRDALQTGTEDPRDEAERAGGDDPDTAVGMEIEPPTARGSAGTRHRPAATRHSYRARQMLTEDQKKKVEKLLHSQREEAVEALREFDEARDDSLGDRLGELSVFRLHPADIGTETMEREKQFLLASAEGRHLQEIDDALRRLIQNPEGFGVCEKCGQDIAMERLEVVPETTLCASCRRETEN